MDCKCTNENTNVYFLCRKEAAKHNENLYSREGASEILGISVSTLAKYELGILNPPVETVVQMSELYNAPNLTSRYCKMDCPIGRCLPISTDISSLEGVTLRLLKCMNEGKLSGMKTKLIDIAADGVISEDEEPDLQEILQELDGMAEAISELRTLAKKRLKEA